MVTAETFDEPRAVALEPSVRRRLAVGINVDVRAVVECWNDFLVIELREIVEAVKACVVGHSQSSVGQRASISETSCCVRKRSASTWFSNQNPKDSL